jgi:hypothetical protein
MGYFIIRRKMMMTMTHKTIANVHPVTNNSRGENYWFDGCTAYVMEALAPNAGGERVAALEVGTWPLAGAHDPTLDAAGIPDGAKLYGLFTERYERLREPELTPGLTRVRKLSELTDGCYCVLYSDSGFDYAVVTSDKPVTVTAKTGPVTEYNYGLFGGVTGDVFTQFWVTGAKSHGECASDYLTNEEYIKSVFDKIGYVAEYVTDKSKFAAKVVEYIDRGVPVISGGLNKPWTIIGGYEGNGKTLLQMPTANYGAKKSSGTDVDVLIFVGDKVRDVPLAQVYREALTRLPEMLTIKTDEYVFGAEAFREWASFIERGGYDNIDLSDHDTNWYFYSNYVCVLATNGSDDNHGFISKAMELNRDLSWLTEIGALYRKFGSAWGGGADPDPDSLEALGGGFNVTNDALRDPVNRAKIVAKLRYCADITDEVVRVLKENMQQLNSNI